MVAEPVSRKMLAGLASPGKLCFQGMLSWVLFTEFPKELGVCKATFSGYMPPFSEYSPHVRMSGGRSLLQFTWLQLSPRIWENGPHWVGCPTAIPTNKAFTRKWPYWSLHMQSVPSGGKSKTSDPDLGYEVTSPNWPMPAAHRQGSFQSSNLSTVIHGSLETSPTSCVFWPVLGSSASGSVPRLWIWASHGLWDLLTVTAFPAWREPPMQNQPLVSLHGICPLLLGQCLA